MFDVDRGGVPPRQPDRGRGGALPDARERDRAGARRGGRALADVLVGSYPSFGTGGSTVEVVLKSSDAVALAAASAWLESAIEESGGR